MHLEGQAGVHTAEHTDQALDDAVARGDLAGHVFLAERAGVQVTDLAAQFAGLTLRGLLQAYGDVAAVGGEDLEGDAVGPQVILQPQGVGEVAQGAAEEEAVEAAEHAQDEVAEAV
jgi:hypothetical protein